MKRERRRLAEGLSGMGFRVVCGEANYLLFKGRPGLDTEMEKRGFLIRNCSNYDGLGEGWYRIAVRTSEENDKLMKALEEALR